MAKLADRIPHLSTHEEFSAIPKDDFDTAMLVATLSENQIIEESVRNLILGHLKSLTVMKSLREQVESVLVNHLYPINRGDQPKPMQHILMMRGVHDFLSLSNWLYFSEKELRKPPKEQHTNLFLLKIYREMLRKIINCIDLPDAVVLYYTDLQTAQERRVAQGKNPNGKMVNERMWPRMDAAYRWWLQHIFPYIRKRTAMGLLVVDGNQSIERNLKVTESFCKKVIAMAEMRD